MGRLRVSNGDQEIQVPESALRMLVDILTRMARGNAVSTMLIDAELRLAVRCARSPANRLDRYDLTSIPINEKRVPSAIFGELSLMGVSMGVRPLRRQRKAQSDQ